MVVAKKDVSGARFVVVRTLVRCTVRLMVVFMIADFLFFLWWFWSEESLSAGGKNAVFLKFWKEIETKEDLMTCLIFYILVSK